MTTALTTATAQPAAKAPIKSGGPIAGIIPQDIEQAFRLSEALAKAGDMVPKSFQGQPMQIMAAVMKGAEVGLAPMQALASIAVINGRPTIWGDAIPGLIQRAGHHVDVEYEGSGDTLTAVATLTRGDTGRVIVRRFGLPDAKRAGLLGKAGPWTQYPQRMIAHRARTWAARDGAADALMGLQVTEEVQDYGPDTARDVTPAPRKGGVVYADPDMDAAPMRDEIMEGEVLDQDLPTPEQRLAAEQAAREAAAAMEREAAE